MKAVTGNPRNVKKSKGIVYNARCVFAFITNKNDFRRNLLVNIALFTVGVWVARNLSDVDLLAPAPPS
uniref:mitochondrial import receptor subunit TOM6 homolog n=1 Tax=Myxine glutinosa TaxID=7769 RepID=UPI00358DDC92